MENNPNAQIIWEVLLYNIGNEIGVSALMGNLQAESGLYPDRVQGDIPYSSYSQEYTAKVDSGEISEYDFVHNGPNGGGYGLAQWTYYARKQNLYNRYKDGGYVSIGDVLLACEFLLWELENDFPDVYEALVDAENILDASNVVLHEFENPANQSEEVEKARALLGLNIYNTFASGTVTPDIPEPAKPKSTHLSKLLMMVIATDDI